MYISETTIRVRYADTDQMSVVYYGNYAEYFEVGRTESIRQLGFTYKDLEAKGIMMPVVELHAKYLRPAKYDDLLTIRTTLRELPTDHKMEFHTEVLNENNKLLCTGRVVLFFLNMSDQKRAKMPSDMLEKYLPYFPNASITP
jgi:acyl-CoA thioester hydrolase